jgi:branched-chain amino acid transport system permease protein
VIKEVASRRYSLIRLRGPVGALALVVLLALVPSVVPAYRLTDWTNVVITCIGACALCLLTGKAGQVSLGTGAFMAVGAYTSVLLSRWYGLGFLPALLVAFVAGAAMGLLVGLPTMRLRGFYLALTTLAFQFIIAFFATRYQARAAYGGAFNLSTAHLGNFQLNSERRWYWVCLIAATLSIWLMRNICGSGIGRAWRALRDNEESASAAGIAAVRYKILAFVVSSAFTALAGVLGAYHLGVVSSESYTLDVTVAYVAMIIIGGVDSFAGAVVGAALITELPSWIQSATTGPIANALGNSIYELHDLVYGVVIVVCLIVAPGGLAGFVRRVWAAGRTRVLGVTAGHDEG